MTEFARWAGLEPQPLIDGQSFEIGGVTLWLLHYAESDPHAATVVIDYGEFSAEKEPVILRRLMEHNLQVSAGRVGYFSLAPGLRKMLYCIRVDLDQAEDPAEAIGDVIGMAVESMRALCYSILEQADSLREAPQH